MFRTVPLSIIKSFSLYTAMVHGILQFPPARKLSANLYDIYHCCVYNEKLLMTGRGTARNMQSFIPEINLRNQCIWLVLLKDSCDIYSYQIIVQQFDVIKNSNRFAVHVKKIHVEQVTISQLRKDKHACMLEGDLIILMNCYLRKFP